MNIAAIAVVALVATQRVVELQYARRNTAALLRKGAIEVGRGHYPLIVALHLLWLAAILLFLPTKTLVSWLWLGFFLVLQIARVWVMASLGPYWTTRIITMPAAPLVRRGPYRFMRHPNYLVVALEIAVLPIAFGEYGVAIVFSVLNALLLSWRIHQEELALRSRRDLILRQVRMAST